VNFIKETLVGLPSVPNEEQLTKLQEKRKKDAENKIAEEKIKAKEAKVRFEQQQLLQNQVKAQQIKSKKTGKKFLCSCRVAKAKHECKLSFHVSSLLCKVAQVLFLGITQ
jgi:hypothetical protein